MAEAAQRATISVDASGGLFLNAAILDFGDATIEVDVLPRSSELRGLRQKHRAAHVRRAERDETLAPPIINGAPRLSEKSKVVSLRENPDFACHLWREVSPSLRSRVSREPVLPSIRRLQRLSRNDSSFIARGAA
jgi:hypothetical protein